MMEAKLSDAYERAQAEGKQILYVCALGRSRSPITAMYANRRGEKGSLSLNGGYQQFYEDRTDPKIDEKISAAVTGKITRIFESNSPAFNWFKDKLNTLINEGKLPRDSVEVISITTVMKEMRSGGQDIADLSRAMLDD